MKDRNGKTLRKGDVCVVVQERFNTPQGFNSDIIGAIIEIDEILSSKSYPFQILTTYGGCKSWGMIGFFGDELEIIGDVR